MARVANSMVTFQDLDDMVSLVAQVFKLLGGVMGFVT